jgi:hypothetical protein
MAKNKWTIEKFKEMDQNLFIQVLMEMNRYIITYKIIMLNYYLVK